MMRLILRALARANLRWAVADLLRADRLKQDADRAMDAAQARLSLARAQTDRATARA